MKLKTKYLLFVGILHLVTLVLSFQIFKENKLIFILSEVFILFSLWLAWGLYKQLIMPLKMLLQGINAIGDQDFSVKFRPTGKHEVDQLIGVYNNMIDNLRAERTIREEQHNFLEKLIETSPTGVVILDFDQQVEQLNPKALQLLGLDRYENLRQAIDECKHPLLPELKNLPAGESKVVSLSGIENYKCQKSFFIDRGFQRYFVMIEELSSEILQSEKKAYGKVIRMMAHEVNNTIGPVNSIMQFALKQYDTEAGRQLQDALAVAIERNNNLNRFMKNLADVVRLPEPDKHSLDLGMLISSVCRLFEYKAAEKGITIELLLADEPLFVRADVHQMEQVFINIIKNSVEAIEQQHRQGTVTLITAHNPARVIIRDTGCGVSEEVGVNLFTPFYTTKKEGQGVGLTLVREVLLSHGFEFSLRTSDGLTDFVVFLR